MNPSTLIGIVASIGLLAVVMLFAAKEPALFIDLPSLGIVLVGTLAATFISYPLREVTRVFGLIWTVMRNERLYTRQDLDELVQISRLWISGDLPAVEKAVEQVSNPFLRTGVQLVIDNTPEEDILELLQWRIARLRARENAEAQLFRAMSNYAPAFGMIGTLVGLINLMFMLGSGNMDLIGRSLAVALMTTFYGVLLANLILKPVAVKLERRTEQRVALMNLVTQGISMMCNRRSPAYMREPQREEEQEAWLITYLDMLTLLLVMLVIMLALAGKGEGQQSEPSMVEATQQSAGDQLVALQPSASPIPSIVPLPAPAADTQQDDTSEAKPDLALGDDIEVIVNDGSISFRISSEILFGSGRAELEDAGLDVIDRLVPTLAAGGHRIIVEGHTDNLPIQTERFPSNWELSASRASSVVRYLQLAGIESTRLSATGYADTRPLADNGDEQGRASNRRVELVMQTEADKP